MSDANDADRAIWHVPLLILAGVTALAGAGVAIAVWREALPEPWGPAIQWGLVGASLTFTVARIVHARRVGKRELELIALAGGVLVAHYIMWAAIIVAAIAVIGLIQDEL